MSRLTKGRENYIRDLVSLHNSTELIDDPDYLSHGDELAELLNEIDSLREDLKVSTDGLKFYADGKFDHEPDARNLFVDEPQRYISQHYGWIARETLSRLNKRQNGDNK